MDDYELARQIRSMPGREATLLIAISGYGQTQNREAALAFGIDHYLVKPVDVSELRGLLASTHRPT